MIEPRLFRAALGLSGHNLTEFCTVTGLDRARLSQFINHNVALSLETFQRMENFFKNRGIYFSENGVYEQREGTRTLTGHDGFREMYELLYEAAQEGGDLCLHNGVSHLAIDTLGPDYVALQQERMKKIKDRFRFRVILEEGDDTYMGAGYCEYKWFPKEHFVDKTKYIFGAYLAYIDFDNDVEIILINNKKNCGQRKN